MLVLSVLSSKIIFGFGQVWLSSPDLCSAGIADSAAIPTIPIQESRAVQETLRQWQNLCFQIIRSFNGFIFQKWRNPQNNEESSKIFKLQDKY